MCVRACMCICEFVCIRVNFYWHHPTTTVGTRVHVHAYTCTWYLIIKIITVTSPLGANHVHVLCTRGPRGKGGNDSIMLKPQCRVFTVTCTCKACIIYYTCTCTCIGSGACACSTGYLAPLLLKNHYSARVS